MTIARSLPTEPPPGILFKPKLHLLDALREVWQVRDLIRTLAERDFRIRYKQAVLGFAWALLTPLALMVVFTIVFQRIARVDTGGVPYPLFAYVGLLPWTFFSVSLTQGGQSLVVNSQLVNKLYCPREVFPIASIMTAAVDTSIALFPLGLLFAITGFAPKATTLWVPVVLAVQLAFTAGLTLFTAAVLVFFRDVRHAIPIALQLGLLATPVAYSLEVVPASLRVAYSVLNPLAPVIDSYRRTILFGLAPDWTLLLPGAISAGGMLVLGYVVFKRLEKGFADYA
jgi:ABC-type polysaccharide/polyol phosphate export permease